MQKSVQQTQLVLTALVLKALRLKQAASVDMYAMFNASQYATPSKMLLLVDLSLIHYLVRMPGSCRRHVLHPKALPQALLQSHLQKHQQQSDKQSWYHSKLKQRQQALEPRLMSSQVCTTRLRFASMDQVYVRLL